MTMDPNYPNRHLRTGPRVKSFDRRVQDFQHTHEMTFELLNGERYSINAVLGEYEINHNILILKLATFTNLIVDIAQDSSLRHSMVTDLTSGRYRIEEVLSYYNIGRNELVLGMAALAKKAVEQLEKAGKSKHAVYELVAYAAEGDGIVIDKLIDWYDLEQERKEEYYIAAMMREQIGWWPDEHKALVGKVGEAHVQAFPGRHTAWE